MEQQVQANAITLAKLDQSLKSAHKRIDDNDRTIEGLHKLAASIDLLASQIKNLSDTTTANNTRMESSIERQGARIGALEKKPAVRWEAMVTQVIGLVVAAAVGFGLSRVM